MRLASFSVWRLLFNLLFWTALFTFVLGVRYYDIGNIAFINLPVQIPTSRIFFNVRAVVERASYKDTMPPIGG